jgi:hypothetical protein
MPNILPGAVWHPINVGGRAKRRKGRGLVGHVAVSASKNLVPPPPSAGKDWHLYLPKSGPAIQYIDMDLQCWSTGAGNASLVAFESEGGLGSTAQVNAEPWTENQLDWAARILRYLHDTEGVPLRVMASSAAGERGFGTHRLGVPGYMAAGGEKWSSSAGKLCPGDAKHAQRFEIVRRAGGITLEDDDMFTEEDRQLLRITAQQLGGPGALDTSGKTPWGWPTSDGKTRTVVDMLRDWVPGFGRRTENTEAMVAGLSGAIAALAAAQPAGGLSAAAIEDAVKKALRENVVQVNVDVNGDAGVQQS